MAPLSPRTRRVTAASAVAALALTAGITGATAAQAGDDSRDSRAKDAISRWLDPYRTPADPTFEDVTVHDPSVVADGDDVWVFGSHGASAHTEDLVSWTQHSVDLSQQSDNPLFEDIYTELAETFAWAQTSTLWAADVVQLPNGQFAMYYNACKGDSPRSALGLATSADVDGPYEDQGILLKSGMWDEESENPGEIYDATVHPNAVDPDAFYDAEGDLWMVYGSYSGGIFILEMDEATGEPLPGQGYGTHLVGGNHSRIEAPSIRYDEETGYYYLFLSFGGLDANGGYDVRVARATSPEGPYLDAEGNDMADVKGAPGTIFDDASIQPYGVKLMGGYQFPRELGDPGSGAGTGYVSPGHTSWYDDPDTGQSFMVLHSRFPGTGEMHEVRVHRMEMTRDGWPVVLPTRYAGEGELRARLTQMIGDWQLVDLGKDITAEPALPVDVRLTALGKVIGEVSGTWRLRGADAVELRIDGVTYEGVISRGWDEQTQDWTATLSVVSDGGVTLWGRAVDVLAPKKAVEAVVDELDLGDTSSVTANLALPTTGTSGTTIAWESSDPSVLATDGSVTRPIAGEADATVTLTATVANGKRSEQVAFEVTVVARPIGGLVGSWSFEDTLADDAGALATPTVTGNRADTTGGAVSYVPDGAVGSAVRLDGASGIRLPNGLVQGDTYSVSMWLRPSAITQFTTAFFAASDANTWLSVVPRGWNGDTMLWATGSHWYDGLSGTTLPLDEWTHVAFTVDEGDVTLYLDGAAVHSGTGFPDVLTSPAATFALGVNYWDAPFQGDVDELLISTAVLTPDEVAALAAP
ncbi:LamG-like jellyroll fold domain-containing protein [Demequina sp. NBRC 110056]|uniref:LamG-like jellyroll fold domain-containing protein n=1 Tax=Demequina sp. NBRC 110056 TaxID=1570345 RepID=UPI001F3A5CF9|nr:LamG-like jellyroll fold domain-containing protein [Demequina sp. NBRC 110056]